MTQMTQIVMTMPQLLWIAPSLSGVLGARALHLVEVAHKLADVPLPLLLLTADILAPLH
jgi:hypothetical protein